jgi:uncharacterized membrane protein
MTTPLIMLMLLTGPWLLLRLWPGGGLSSLAGEAAGRWGLSLTFLFAASGHFLMDDTMAQMLPPWVPARIPLVWASGVLEVAIALALLNPRARQAAAWTALAVLVVFYPANVYAAWQQVPMGGHAWGLSYLWVRTPLQLVLLAWTWRFGLGRPLPWRPAR